MSTEIEIRSFALLNTHIYSVLSFFDPNDWDDSVKDIIYFKNRRYVDGKFQRKIRTSTSCRSFLPGIRTYCNESTEFRTHESLSKFVISSPGRKLSLSMSDIRESVKKKCYQHKRYPCIQAKVYVTCNAENRVLTVVVLEVEHRESNDVKFLYLHCVGQHYRTTVEQFWTRHVKDLVILSGVKPFSPVTNWSHLKAGLTKPVNPTQTEICRILNEYDTFLPKLNGIPGYMFFKNNVVTVKLADKRIFVLKNESTFLNYQWSDDVVLRIEYMSPDDKKNKSLDTAETQNIFVTDVVVGAHGEPMHELPYRYRLTYLQKLHRTVIPTFRVNWNYSTSRHLDPTDTTDCDGILLIRSLASEHCFKLKWSYTVDLRFCRPPDKFVTRDNVFYQQKSLPLASSTDEREDRGEEVERVRLVRTTVLQPDQIYECVIDENGLVIPFKIRLDKNSPDDNQTVLLCRDFLNPRCTVSHIWPNGRIGQKDQCVLPNV